MSKSKYVLKRKGVSRKKKHVRFNLTHSRKLSRTRTLRRTSTLGFALKKRSRRTRVKTRSVTRGKYRSRTRGRTRTRLGGFRGGYGPGGGPVGAPWDGVDNVPGHSVQGLPSANHYAYNKGGIGVGGVDPAVSTRTIEVNQKGGSGLMDLMPQGLNTAFEVTRNAIGSTYKNITMETDIKDVNPLPTHQNIDDSSKIVYPGPHPNLDDFTTEAATQASAI